MSADDVPVPTKSERNTGEPLLKLKSYGNYGFLRQYILLQSYNGDIVIVPINIKLLLQGTLPIIDFILLFYIIYIIV